MKAGIDRIDIFITAGGKSTRMGQDKGLMQLSGKPMICYLTDMLERNDLPYKIIAHSAAYKIMGFHPIQDIIPDKGPMGALLTALYHTEKDYILLLGCDTPFLPLRVIHRLAENLREGKSVVSLLGENLYPLQAVYPVSLIDTVISMIECNMLKMKELISRTDHILIKMDDIIQSHPTGFFNFNQSKDIETWKRLSEKN